MYPGEGVGTKLTWLRTKPGTRRTEYHRRNQNEPRKVPYDNQVPVVVLLLPECSVDNRRRKWDREGWGSKGNGVFQGYTDMGGDQMYPGDLSQSLSCTSPLLTNLT